MYCRISKNIWSKYSAFKIGYRKDACHSNGDASTSVAAKCKGKRTKYIRNFIEKYDRKDF
jgi:hypothetical protein